MATINKCLLKINIISLKKFLQQPTVVTKTVELKTTDLYFFVSIGTGWECHVC